jgi:protein gp37
MKWRKPRLVFVDSMGDLFHGHVFKRYISAVFGVMAATPHHTYQVLTKRPENVRDWLNWLEGEVEIGTGETPLRVCLEYAWRSNKLLPRYLDVPWPLKNVWLIVSAEDQERLEERAASLMYLPAAVRGVSLEPLLGPVRLRRWIDRYYGKSYNSLDWVIVGCESGPGRRPFKLSWARSIKNQCVEHGVPFFFKQAPGHVEQDGYVKEKILEMPELDGKVWNQYPDGYER